jgi:uncharacterized membrane protein YesL
MHELVSGYYRFSVWTMRFAYLNLCWVAFTVLGLFVFGFMPATTAMFAIVRKWINKEDDIRILSTFWSIYRKEFVKSNGIGLLLFAIGYFLVIEFNILRTQESLPYVIASFTVLATIVLLGIVFVYFFPIFVHFNLKLIDYLKWPFIIGIKHPILSLFIIGGIGIIYYVTWITIPALFFFFGGSMTAFFIMWGVSQAFSEYEYHEV